MTKEKILNILGVICLIILIVFSIWMIIAFNNMIDDHECWIDGYRGEHCQKYIRGE